MERLEDFIKRMAKVINESNKDNLFYEEEDSFGQQNDDDTQPSYEDIITIKKTMENPEDAMSEEEYNSLSDEEKMEIHQAAKDVGSMKDDGTDNDEMGGFAKRWNDEYGRKKVKTTNVDGDKNTRKLNYGASGNLDVVGDEDKGETKYYLYIFERGSVWGDKFKYKDDSKYYSEKHPEGVERNYSELSGNEKDGDEYQADEYPRAKIELQKENVVHDVISSLVVGEEGQDDASVLKSADEIVRKRIGEAIKDTVSKAKADEKSVYEKIYHGNNEIYGLNYQNMFDPYNAPVVRVDNEKKDEEKTIQERKGGEDEPNSKNQAYVLAPKDFKEVLRSYNEGRGKGDGAKKDSGEDNYIIGYWGLVDTVGDYKKNPQWMKDKQKKEKESGISKRGRKNVSELIWNNKYVSLAFVYVLYRSSSEVFADKRNLADNLRKMMKD